MERQTILFEIQGTTIDELESAQTSVRQYEAQVDEYRLKLQSLTKNGVNNNNDILIKAPFDAEVSWINVKLEESVSTDNELLTLGGSSAIRVEAAVDQGDIDQILEGQQAIIQANDKNRTVIPGVVTSFGSTGSTDSSVVTFPVIIKPQIDVAGKSDVTNRRDSVILTSPKETNGDDSGSATPGKPEMSLFQGSQASGVDVAKLLKTGMTVDVTIMADFHSNVLAIPLRAVIEENGETMVNILENGQFVSKKVELGFRNENYAEVLSGLNEGDQVGLVTNPTVNSGGGSARSQMRVGGGMRPPM